MSFTDFATYVCLGLTAAIEAMVALPEDAVQHLHLSALLSIDAIRVAPAVLLILLVLLYLGRFLLGKRARRPKVEILTPVNGEGVGLSRNVRGSASPAGALVQIFVYSGDKLWHPQKAPVHDGFLWTSECQFGLPHTGQNEAYKVVALIGGERVTRPVRSIPRWRNRSTVVSVSRLSA